MGYYLTDFNYRDEYQDYNLVSLRPITWKEKLSRLERLIAKEEAIKEVTAAEKTIRLMDFPDIEPKIDFPRKGILINFPPKKYVKYLMEIYSNLLESEKKENWLPLILSKTEEIVVGSESDNYFTIPHEREYLEKEQDDIRRHQFINLHIYPEDGRRGILFYVSKTCRSTIPFDLMRVEITMPIKLEKSFFELYEHNLRELSTQR